MPQMSRTFLAIASLLLVGFSPLQNLQAQSIDELLNRGDSL